MAYNYYRQNTPDWGTSQLQFGRPPAPTFQPQPNWGGMDYYNAHAVNPETSMYDHAWGRVRSHAGSALELGVGKHEARHWHRRAYGGLMLPSDIGHAAAYEAYRTWTHNSSLYEPLSSEIERQREGLVGLAVAEASRLLQFSNRAWDAYARRDASDAAAATASILFYHSREREEGDYHRSRSRHRSGSFSGSYDPDEDSYGNDYRYPRHRSHSHHRSISRSHSPVMSQAGSVTGSMGGAPMLGGHLTAASMTGSAPISIPLQAGSAAYGAYGNSSPYPTTATMPMQIHGQNSSYGVPYASSQQPYGGQMQAGSYGGMSYTQPMSQPYGGAPVVIQTGSSSHHHRPRSYSTSGYQVAYPQTAAPQVQYMQPGYGGQLQPQAIIIGSGHRKHRHHKKSKRSKSIDYPRYS
ncbi:unnamed protein product [Mycena citricolor]|uniref:Uncharacterized protein n=1 Tax=Mycena citricolor TaxID=2018698 RepID=A0AAD2K869_9AGAR|nr:unnamed protein product [Mycena citricolor]